MALADKGKARATSSTDREEANHDLVRFGVAMDRGLLEQFDGVVAERGATRSEVLRDLARAAVTRHRMTCEAEAVGTITFVYNHHVRDLSDRLTEIQHGLGTMVHCAMHVHLDPERCLEVIVVRGRADVLRKTADQILSTRGVTHGGIEIVALSVKEGDERAHGAHAHHHHVHGETHHHD